ncbi:MAG TPA: AtpZ/AtpI family protein [Candidatus Binataceae bacterium]|jgi:ATP synthase protein I
MKSTRERGTGGLAPEPPGRDNLPRQARLRSERRARFEREGERAIGKNIALMGSLGWLIVIPALVGMGAGVWLDRIFKTGVFWSGALLVVGLALGCWLAWQRIAEE